MPRVGELQDTDVWAAATRTLTQIDVEEVFDLPTIPTGYPATSLTSSASADTFGSWTQLVADVGSGKRLLFALIQTAVAGAGSWEVEFGEGAALGEAAVTRVSMPWGIYTEAGPITTYIVPLYYPLTAGARLSARAKDTASSARTYRIIPMYV